MFTTTSPPAGSYHTVNVHCGVKKKLSEIWDFFTQVSPLFFSRFEHNWIQNSWAKTFVCRGSEVLKICITDFQFKFFLMAQGCQYVNVRRPAGLVQRKRGYKSRGTVPLRLLWHVNNEQMCGSTPPCCTFSFIKKKQTRQWLARQWLCWRNHLAKIWFLCITSTVLLLRREIML